MFDKFSANLKHGSDSNKKFVLQFLVKWFIGYPIFKPSCFSETFFACLSDTSRSKLLDDLVFGINIRFGGVVRGDLESNLCGFADAVFNGLKNTRLHSAGESVYKILCSQVDDVEQVYEHLENISNIRI